jgi:thiol-disulfide isomerase/thioredoxin
MKSVFGQTAEPIKKAPLLQLFKPDSGMVVVNFWSTWCKPCMQEMQFFVKADSAFKSKGVQFVFVSLDMSEDIAKVNGVIKAKKLPGTHYLLDETDMNDIINAVDSSWSGGIPATWFLSPLYRKPWLLNFEHYDDLLQEIELFIAASDESEK